ncbi:hypothetical protein ID866_4768 [Astraeus odoratus]|nr:hypothetical protein ID866_4768 [Astraeus odoratus]
MVNTISFTGDTHFEVIAVLANCGTDTDKARQALVTWILKKQEKGRSTEHILNKLRQLELKFIQDESLHDAFRHARAQTNLPRSLDLPLPEIIYRRNSRSKEKQRDDGSPSDPWYRERSDCSRSSSPTSPLSPFTLTGSPSHRSPWHRRWDSRSDEGQSSTSISHYPPSSSGSLSISPKYPSTLHSPYQPRAAGRMYYNQKQTILAPPSPPSIPCPPSPIDPPRRNRSVSNPVPSQPTSSRPSLQPPNRLSAPATSVPRRIPAQPIPQSPCSSAASSTVSVVSPVSPDPQPYNDHCMRVPSPMAAPYSSEESVTTVTDFERYIPSDIDLSDQDCYSSLKIVTRSDSPLRGNYSNDRHNYNFNGADLPPPYDNRLDRSELEPPTIGPSLDRALRICNASAPARQEVLKCIRMQSGYEPKHWQTRLTDCDLNSEAIDFLMEEMCKQLEAPVARH